MSQLAYSQIRVGGLPGHIKDIGNARIESGTAAEGLNFGFFVQKAADGRVEPYQDGAIAPLGITARTDIHESNNGFDVDEFLEVNVAKTCTIVVVPEGTPTFGEVATVRFAEAVTPGDLGAASNIVDADHVAIPARFKGEVPNTPGAYWLEINLPS